MGLNGVKDLEWEINMILINDIILGESFLSMQGLIKRWTTYTLKKQDWK